ncbi:hypothetical protein HV356_18135 [Citrobacter sp. RHBSTW-01065]|nr:hypothetical protein [Citrobacter sp. RHBSTW-01065]
MTVPTDDAGCIRGIDFLRGGVRDKYVRLQRIQLCTTAFAKMPGSQRHRATELT